MQKRFGMAVKEMANIADLIEEYILRRLAAEQNRKVELRRTDIAGEIACAPSQISYVLSTRFTQEKGFLVESRRGLGGYIRIAKVPVENLIYRDILQRIDENTTPDDVKRFVGYLKQHGMIESREAALVLQFAGFACARLTPQERAELLRSIFLTLANFS